jgi:hypothetical protein
MKKPKLVYKTTIKAEARATVDRILKAHEKTIGRPATDAELFRWSAVYFEIGEAMEDLARTRNNRRKKGLET